MSYEEEDTCVCMDTCCEPALQMCPVVSYSVCVCMCVCMYVCMCVYTHTHMEDAFVSYEEEDACMSY